MFIQAKAEYQCGGYPAPTYKGILAVALNISQEATDDQIEEELRAKAKQLAAQQTCFDDSLVIVVGLTDIEYALTVAESDKMHACGA